jgi:hypothetical protein
MVKRALLDGRTAIGTAEGSDLPASLREALQAGSRPYHIQNHFLLDFDDWLPITDHWSLTTATSLPAQSSPSGC